MYCSITFKGRKDPQDPKMVKLEMIFYKTGYTRIPRVVSITGAYKCWNNETLSFEIRFQRIPQEKPTAA